MDPENAAIAAEAHASNRAAVAKASRERAAREAPRFLSPASAQEHALGQAARAAGFREVYDGDGWNIVDRHDPTVAYVWRSYWTKPAEKRGVEVSFAVRICDGEIVRAEVSHGGRCGRPDLQIASPVDAPALFEAWKGGAP